MNNTTPDHHHSAHLTDASAGLPQTTPNGLVVGDDGLARPPWAAQQPEMREYYDDEWSNPVTDERGCYERLALEGFQAGLSWRTVLLKREALRELFAGFDPEAVARFGDAEIASIMDDARGIRSACKVTSAINNARLTLSLRERALSPDGTDKNDLDRRLAGFELPNGVRVEPGLPALLWSFRPEKTPRPLTVADIPTQSEESKTMAKTLKKLGFSFVGPTTCFALMEAIGIVDTNLVGSHKRGRSGIWPEEEES
ncbi:DNA-3-methyladenine glycosylase I [Rothia sp. LK2588]|uniref:DNA-3-methyladenine glycosylase I n=1 Tax=Rothia sp. LK2588 TaxID=3114369 RepID=UPI0034CD7394